MLPLLLARAGTSGIPRFWMEAAPRAGEDGGVASVAVPLPAAAQKRSSQGSGRWRANLP